MVKAVEVQRFVSSFTSGKRVSVSELDAKETPVPGGGRRRPAFVVALCFDSGWGEDDGKKGRTLIENLHERKCLRPFLDQRVPPARRAASDADMLLFPPLKSLSVSLL